MCFRQIFAIGPFTLKQIGNGVEPDTVYTQPHPEIDHLEHFSLYLGIVKVEIRLVGVKTMPVVGFGHRIPGPVGGLEVLKDNPCIAVLFRCVAPDVKVPMGGALFCLASPLEPGMLV